MSEMWEAWALVALALLAWLWFDSMRSRERAVAACERACERDGLQFLDETVVDQKRWTEVLFTLCVKAEVAGFEAGQFAKLALEVEGEMVARPYSFVNAPKERPHEFYYVTLPEG